MAAPLTRAIGQAGPAAHWQPADRMRRYKDYVHASHVEEDMSFWQVSGLSGLHNSPDDGWLSLSYATGSLLASSAL